MRAWVAAQKLFVGALMLLVLLVPQVVITLVVARVRKVARFAVISDAHATTVEYAIWSELVREVFNVVDFDVY